MLLFWRIRYLDRKVKEFKDRDLWLDTNSLDAVLKAAIEATYALGDGQSRRNMLRFRQIFQEKIYSAEEERALYEQHGGMRSVFIHDYFEDETAREMTNSEMAAALTGNADAILIPSGARQHDIDYIQTKKGPVDIERVTLTAEQLTVLGIFSRDFRELSESALLKEKGPATISCGGRTSGWVVSTAVSDEEIRSFVMIFRRLYMDKEPANFKKATVICADVLSPHPLADWVRGSALQYEVDLQEQPRFVPNPAKMQITFSSKRLIDVFLYTRYAHQPDDQRSRQYRECLACVGDNQPLLTYMFLTEIWKTAVAMRGAGQVISNFYDHYVQVRNLKPEIPRPLIAENPELGSLEKYESRRKRIFRETTVELAKALWKNAGQPHGGYQTFLKQAQERLLHATGIDKDAV